MNKIASFVAASLLAGVAPAQTGTAPKLTAQDLLDIRQLIDGYAHILDNCTNNGNDYADLFTSDATFGVSSEWGKAKIWFRGRDQLQRAGGGTASGTCRPQQSEGYGITSRSIPSSRPHPPARAQSRRC